MMIETPFAGLAAFINGLQDGESLLTEELLNDRGTGAGQHYVLGLLSWVHYLQERAIEFPIQFRFGFDKGSQPGDSIQLEYPSTVPGQTARLLATTPEGEVKEVAQVTLLPNPEDPLAKSEWSRQGDDQFHLYGQPFHTDPGFWVHTAISRALDTARERAKVAPWIDNVTPMHPFQFVVVSGEAHFLRLPEIGGAIWTGAHAEPDYLTQGNVGRRYDVAIWERWSEPPEQTESRIAQVGVRAIRMLNGKPVDFEGNMKPSRR